MPQFDPISATEYNNIRSSIAQQVGDFSAWTDHGFATSTTTSGYGRSFSSNTVTASSDIVTEQQMFDLYLDIQSAHVHIFNSINAAIAITEFEGKTTYPNDADTLSRDKVTYSHLTDLTTVANAIAGFNYGATEFNQASFDTSTLKLADNVTSVSQIRTTNWGGASQTQSINHIVEVDFGSHNNMLYYLNSGGEIRFDAQLLGGSTGTSNTKDWDWNRILTAMGTIRTNYRGGNWVTESYTGTGTGSSVSSLSVSTSNPTTLMFTKQGGGVTGGTPGSTPVTQIYDDNFYRIYGATNTSFSTATKLLFKIEFDDGDAGTGGQAEPGGAVGSPIDEPVTGTVYSNVYSHTPNSSITLNGTPYNAIARPVPTGIINTTL